MSTRRCTPSGPGSGCDSGWTFPATSSPRPTATNALRTRGPGCNADPRIAAILYAWPASTADRLIRASGKPVQVRPQPVSAAEFRREFLRAMSWADTHTTFVGAALVLGAMALAIGIPIATIWIHW